MSALLLAGCATADPSPPRSAERPTHDSAPAASARCSPGDPDRWVWFCVIGQALYAIGANLQVDPPHLRSP